MMASRKVRLTFSREKVTEPLIYNAGRRFEVVTNIRRADVTSEIGWVLLEMTGEPDQLEQAVAYLEAEGVRVDQAEGDLVEG